MRKIFWFALLLATGCEECDHNMHGCRTMCEPRPVLSWSPNNGCVCDTGKIDGGEGR